MSDDLDISWIEEVAQRKEEKPKKQCPYCKKEFVKLFSHIKSCPKRPNKESISTMDKNHKLDLEVRELKIQLEESKEAIKYLVEDVRRLQHHELNEKNITDYFRTVKYAKKYELYRAFTPHDTRLIDKIVKKMYKEGTLRRNQNYWYSLNPKFKESVK